jgi:hypothetical protein
MTHETTITLTDGTEADVTVEFTHNESQPAGYVCGECRPITPPEPESIDIISVITCDGVDVTYDIDDEEALELELLESI